MLMWPSQRRLRQPHPSPRLLLALPIVVLLCSSTSAAPAAASSREAESPVHHPVPLSVLDTSAMPARPMRVVLPPATEELNAHSLMKGISESLARLRQQSTDALTLDNTRRPAGLRQFGARAAMVASLFDKIQFASILCEAIYDGPKDEALKLEFRHVRKMYWLVSMIQDIVRAEFGNIAIRKIADRSKAIIMLAGSLLTACRKGGESGEHSIFNHLGHACTTLDPYLSLRQIRSYSESSQYSILSSHNPHTIDEVHFSLALILGNLLRATDICATVQSLTTAGDDWRSQHLNQVSRSARRDSFQDVRMITEARTILKDFRVRFRPKLLQRVPIFVVLATASAVLLFTAGCTFFRKLRVHGPEKTDVMATASTSNV